MLYVLIDKADVIVQGPVLRDKRPDDMPQKGWRWLPVEDKEPAVEPSKKVYAHVGWTISADKATKVYEVKDRPAAAPTTDERLSAIEARLDALEGK